MTTSRLGLTILATMMAMMALGVNGAPNWFAPTTVHITNGLSNGNQVLMHCKSKDNDLGQRYLKGGQSWHWTFRVNIQETTLFFCNFDTVVGSGTFTIFDARRELKFCNKNCRWTINDKGVQGYKENNEPYWFFPWE